MQSYIQVLNSNAEQQYFKHFAYVKKTIVTTSTQTNNNGAVVTK